MAIAIESHGEVTIFRLTGEITETVTAQMVDAARERLADHGSRMLIDLSAVKHINSTALSGLVQIAAQANVQEGRVVLGQPSPYVAGVLEMTKLNQFFEIAPTLEEGLWRLGA